MSGLDLVAGFAFGVATISVLHLLWYLCGPEMAIICAGTIVLGTALNLTPSPKQKRGFSRKTLPLSPCSLSRLASEVDDAQKKHVYTPRGVGVTPTSPVLFQRAKRKRCRPLAVVSPLPNFEKDSSPSSLMSV